ncbi:MAG: sigma-54-dependent Fis family transcriptional regulator [Blastocatellia bacterium]|nr:sigma-54-dependent Fis family transcriptional regulator [Blastocatellia bacterium]
MTTVCGKILIVDDEESTRELLAHLIEMEGLTPLVAFDGEMALQIIRNENPDLLLVDHRIPGLTGLEVLRRAREIDEDLPVIVINGYAAVRNAVEAMQAGAYNYLAKPFNFDEVIQLVFQALNERKRSIERRYCSHTGDQSLLREMMGTSKVISRLIADVSRVAGSNFSVLITGETGSGKELVARAIHEASLRAKGPFIPIDCGAIPEALVESELFGYEKGAFTGAHSRKPGRFEEAQHGTLFLDEISNLSLAAQAKLLRVLQEKVFYRVGGSKPLAADVRVLAASNLDHQTLAASGSFREDLFFRLNEFSIIIPPLRERSEDILYLANRFLELTKRELNKHVSGFSRTATEMLLSYNWPGNVRQLRSAIRRAALLADEVITEEHLNLGDRSYQASPRSVPAVPSWRQLPLKEIVRRSTIAVEREVLIQALSLTRGNKAKASRLLQIDYKTMRSKIKEYGIAINESMRKPEEAS